MTEYEFEKRNLPDRHSFIAEFLSRNKDALIDGRDKEHLARISEFLIEVTPEVEEVAEMAVKFLVVQEKGSM